MNFKAWTMLLALAAPVSLAAAQTPASPARITCERFTIQSALGAGGGAQYAVAGTLCSPSPTSGRTLQLLMAGSFYDQSYWDFPYQPGRYSYVRAMNAAGYATLAFDRPGVGLSGKPPADQLSGASYAYVTSRLIRELRGGMFAARKFGRIVLVGHSFGSSSAVLTASSDPGVNGLVLTAFLHAFGPGGQRFGAAVYPAADDARFRSETLPAGYLTLRPGEAGRSLLFLDPAHTDPNVLAVDEATKWTTAGGEADSFLKVVGTPALTQALKVPVLSMVGALDSIFCTPPDCPQAKDEARNYAGNVQVSVVPDTSHALNLHRSAPETFGLIRAWLDRTFGTGVAR